MTLRILIHDVGHGQAIHAFMPNGQVVVIDLGRSDAFSPLKWLRQTTDTIDSLIITHPHGDHIDEILDLQSLNINVRQLSRPTWLTAAEVRQANQSNYSAKVERYLAMSNSYIGEIPQSSLVGNPSVTSGVSVTQYWSPNCGRSNINNHSGVVVFEYLGCNVVIPGDNEPSSWWELLTNPRFCAAARSANVFLASHHGRASGYLANLFEETTGVGKPHLCVVSDGPVQETDATARYSYHAKGWLVHSRNGRQAETRSCITTRSSGYVDINIGRDSNTGRAFCAVTAN